MKIKQLHSDKSIVLRFFSGLLFLFLINIGTVYAQPEIKAVVGQVSGGRVPVDIKLKGFVNVVNIQFPLVWDPTVLKVDAINTTNITNRTTFLSEFATGDVTEFVSRSIDEENNGGVLRVIWADLLTQPNTVPDNETMLRIWFTVLNANGQTDITIANESPINKFFKFEVRDVNGLSLTVNKIPGHFPATATQGLTLTAGNKYALNGQGVCVPITAKNFTNIETFQFNLQTNEAIAKYDGIAGIQNIRPELNPLNFNYASPEVKFSWNIPGSTPLSLPDNTKLFDVCYTVLGTNGQSTDVSFTGPVQASDNTGIIPVTTEKGKITVGVEGQDCQSSDFVLQLPHTTLCAGDSICLDLKSKNATDVIGMTFRFDFDPSVVQFKNITFNGLLKSGVVTPFFDNTAGWVKIIVASPENLTYVDTTLFQVCFRAVGATGTSTTLHFNGQDLLNGIQIESEDNDNLPYFLCDGEIKIECPSCTVSLVPTNPLCSNSCDGKITANVVGLSGTINYTWSPGTFPSQNKIEGLCPQTYTVTATANNISCTSSVTLTAPDPINITGIVTNDVNGQNKGKIDVTVQGGTGAYTYKWDNGGQSTTQDLDNLPAGTYTVTVTDANQCSTVKTFTVGNDTGGGTLTVSITSTDTKCSENDCSGSASAVVQGGTPAYKYQWIGPLSSPSVYTTKDINNLCPGVYNLTVTDNENRTQTATVTIKSPTKIGVLVSTIPSSSENPGNGSATANVTGGTSPYTYKWSNNQTGFSIKDLEPGIYRVTVTDANGCTAETSGEVVKREVECFTFRNVITPNGDGKNDYFYIHCAEYYENTLEIYNRWGKLVYNTKNYHNDWTGLDNNANRLPDGGYYFIFKVLNNSADNIKKGAVSIVRGLDY